MADTVKNPFENFKVEIDPERIDEAVRSLAERVRALADQSRHVKVRVKYKGKALMQDIQLPVFAAAEVVSFWWAGLMQALVMNLGMKAFLEIEFIHEADEKVAEGRVRFAEGDVEAAEIAYREALRMKPNDPGALYHLGVLLRVSGRKDEAIAALEKAAAATGHPDAPRAQELLDKIRSPGKTL